MHDLDRWSPELLNKKIVSLACFQTIQRTRKKVEKEKGEVVKQDEAEKKKQEAKKRLAKAAAHVAGQPPPHMQRDNGSQSNLSMCIQGHLSRHVGSQLLSAKFFFTLSCD